MTHNMVATRENFNFIMGVSNNDPLVVTEWSEPRKLDS